MVTQRPKVPKHGRKPPPKPQPIRPAFYLKEWRKFMGVKPIDMAEALDIQRQSYHRLEKSWWTINLGELDIICKTLGIKQSQLRFPPPKKGEPEPPSVDDLMEDIPEDMQPAAILALRGMARR